MKKIVCILGLIIFLNQIEAQSRYFVSSKGSDLATGRSWESAFKTLQRALNEVNKGDEIWVSAGVYQPEKNLSYKMQNGVAIYGGFVGVEMNIGGRNWGKNRTILKGNGSSVIRNHYTVNNPLDTTAILDGFFITEGKGSVCPPNHNAGMVGGGIYNEYASPTIQNCIIENCVADGAVGIGNYHYSNPKILNTIIRNNISLTHDGGGMCIADGASPVLKNVKILNNVAIAVGGGIFVTGDKSKILMENCEVRGNKARRGGGLFLHGSGDNPSIIQNVLISENTAHSEGGGVMVYNSIAKFVNVTLSENTAGNIGGAFSNNTTGYATSVEFVNSIIWDNSTGNNLLNIYVCENYDCETAYSYSLVEGSNGSGIKWNSKIGKDKGNNIDKNPKFVKVKNNLPEEKRFLLRRGSPAVDAGNRSENNLSIDLDGNPRITGSEIDLGTFEYIAR